MSVIECFALFDDNEEPDKREFYMKIPSTLRDQSGNINILMGDLNAKVDRVGYEITGKHGLWYWRKIIVYNYSPIFAQ